MRNCGRCDHGNLAKRNCIRLRQRGVRTRCRFEALAAIYDAGSICHFAHCNVGPSWALCEIGAASGSIAAWPCPARDFIGSCVLATDIDTYFMQSPQSSLEECAAPRRNRRSAASSGVRPHSLAPAVPTHLTIRAEALARAARRLLRDREGSYWTLEAMLSASDVEAHYGRSDGATRARSDRHRPRITFFHSDRRIDRSALSAGQHRTAVRPRGP